MWRPSTERARTGALLLLAALAGGCATAPAPEAEPEQPTEIDAPTRAAFERAVDLMRAGDYAAAIEAFQAVSERNDTLAGPYVNIGIAHRALDEPDEARAALEAALERDRDNGPAWNQLGLLHRHAGRFSEARSAYEDGIDRDPGYARLYRNLGILCDIYLQNPSCALKNFRAYQERSDEDDEEIERWIADVERRAE